MILWSEKHIRVTEKERKRKTKNPRASAQGDNALICSTACTSLSSLHCAL